MAVKDTGRPNNWTNKVVEFNTAVGTYSESRGKSEIDDCQWSLNKIHRMKLVTRILRVKDSEQVIRRQPQTHGDPHIC